MLRFSGENLSPKGSFFEMVCQECVEEVLLAVAARMIGDGRPEEKACTCFLNGTKCPGDGDEEPRFRHRGDVRAKERQGSAFLR